jgi:hypothetical protein
MKGMIITHYQTSFFAPHDLFFALNYFINIKGIIFIK